MTEQKRHILILSSWYPNRENTFIGNFVQRQAELLSSMFEVTVLITKSDSSLNKIEIVQTNKNQLSEIIVYYPKGNTIFQKYLQQKKAFKAGIQLIKKVDLIHGHVMLPKGLQFITAKKIFNCPLLITEHGSYFRSEIKENRSFLEKIILKKLNKHIDKLTCVSNFLKVDLQSDFTNHLIEILPNHVDTKSFIPSIKEETKRKEFLHVSTLDEKVKNPKGIIDACSILLNYKKADFHLTIISDEPFEKWKKYANENRLSEHISFKGPLNWLELVPFYQKSDAFILFSSYETFSIVLAESWACGIPTITTSVGIGNQLPSSLGFQVDINNPKSLANAMLEIMNETAIFDSSFIRSHAEQFSGENVLSTYDTLLLDLLKK